MEEEIKVGSYITTTKPLELCNDVIAPVGTHGTIIAPLKHQAYEDGYPMLVGWWAVLDGYVNPYTHNNSIVVHPDEIKLRTTTHKTFMVFMRPEVNGDYGGPAAEEVEAALNWNLEGYAFRVVEVDEMPSKPSRKSMGETARKGGL